MLVRCQKGYDHRELDYDDFEIKLSLFDSSGVKLIPSCTARRVLGSTFHYFARLFPCCRHLCQVDDIFSPRTSISSSVRFSISGDYPERSPEGHLNAGECPKECHSKTPEVAPEETSRGWFDIVFAGMSFKGMGRWGNVRDSDEYTTVRVG